MITFTTSDLNDRLHDLELGLELEHEHGLESGLEHKRYRLQSKIGGASFGLVYQGNAHGPESISTSNSNKKDSSRGGKKNQRRGNGKNNTTYSSQSTQRQYCTQKCLLGITRGSVMDESCPNASSHPQIGKMHAIKQLEFLHLV